MPNPYFQFKQFTIQQDRCAMKVTTDACLFGAWTVGEAGSSESRARKILDIGTGTGLLSLMLAQKINAFIDTVEIDKDSFEQASGNIFASPWKDRVSVYHADVRDFSFSSKYDIIISNPPFYENELKSANEKKNIAHHGGLSLNDLLQVIVENLEVNGRYYLLLPFKRMTEFESLLSKYDLVITEYMLAKQSTGHDYFRILAEGKHSHNRKEPYLKNEIAIWNEKKEYTNEFIGLLKDYYLHL